MSYEITITETRSVVRKVGREWAQTGTKEVPRDQRYIDGKESEPKTRMEPTFGHTPEVEKTVTETRNVLTQIVEELDLPAVVKAINKL